jgi:hypothetical protein
MSAKSLPHKFADIVSGVRQLTKLLDTVGDHLDEDEIEQLSRVVLAGLLRRSGLDRETFRDSVTAVLLGTPSS